MRLRVAFVAVLVAVADDVGPINVLSTEVGHPSPTYIPDTADDGSTVVGLAFSGGGTRAAAFSYGVLRALDDIVIDERPKRRTLVDDIRMTSGASGGAVATYFDYKVNPDIKVAVAAIQARAGVRPAAIMTAAAN